LGSPLPVLGEERDKGVVLLFKINLSTIISMKTFRWELSFDVVIEMGIFKINQIMLFPPGLRSNLTGMGLPKTAMFLGAIAFFSVEGDSRSRTRKFE